MGYTLSGKIWFLLFICCFIGNLCYCSICRSGELERENISCFDLLRPGVNGLVFHGSNCPFGKNQHTPCAFAVSPVRPTEYIIAKVSSLSAVSLVVAAILALAASVDRLHIVLLGTVISSIIFTLLGIITATSIISLNQFVLWTVPIELVCFVPAILHLFKITPAWLRYYPINVCMEMVSGSAPSVTGIFIVTVLVVVLFVLSKYCVLKMWSSTGGAKL